MNPPPLPGQHESDALAGAEQLRKSAQRILAECGKVIVGQKEVLEQLLIALFAQGHCLLVGVPGLAKTLMIRTLAESMDLSFKRIQFTPDLMPSDITGTDILQDDRETGHRGFKFIPGPLFANVVLADEINRTPPKTQAALLEAMQEHQVTVGGQRYVLPDPFFVLATQNPIEQEGTYPLPEAQQDRFMFNIRVEYPTEAEEFRIVESTTRRSTAKIEHAVSGPDLKAMQALVMEVPVAEHVIKYAMRLTRRTRVDAPDAPDFVKKFVTWGAGPRASQYLVWAGKSRALLYGRPYVATEDIKAMAYPVLRHRIITNYNAEAEGIKTDDIIRRLIESTEV